MSLRDTSYHIIPIFFSLPVNQILQCDMIHNLSLIHIYHIVLPPRFMKYDRSVFREFYGVIISLLPYYCLLYTSRLIKQPSEYKVIEILQLIEGNLAPVACLCEGVKKCESTAECTTLPFWQGLEMCIRDSQMVMFTLSKFANLLHLANPLGIIVVYLGFGAGLAVFMFKLGRAHV